MALDYHQFVRDFTLESVEAELDGSLRDGFNACTECCTRHVRAGRGERNALTWLGVEGSEETWTYADLDRASAQVGDFLRSRGVVRGDVVACMLPRIPELVAVALGTWRIGAVYQPLFTAFGHESIAYRLQQAGAKLVVTSEAFRDRFDPIPDLPPVALVCKTPDAAARTGDLDFRRGVAAQGGECDPVTIGADERFLQMFTSGTVGNAKGVPLPIRALPAFQIYMRYAIGLREQDRFWNMADPGWAYGLYYGVAGPLMLGAHGHFNEAGFDPEDTVRFLERYRITNLASAPTAYRMLKSSGVCERLQPALQLRCASSAGEPLNTEVIEWGRAALGCEVRDHYGQTEIGMVCCNHHALSHRVRTGGMGLPMPGFELAVADPDGRPVETGETGQLAVNVPRSPAHFFPGYSTGAKDPMRGDYYLTGDVVAQEEDGTFVFAGRSDDIILTAGYRVGPTEVENTLLEHPAVAESAAVGRPDPERGEVIVSFAVLRDGFTPGPALAREIQDLVRDRLSRHAFPRQVEFVEALPKTPSGKIQRFKLRRIASGDT